MKYQWRYPQHKQQLHREEENHAIFITKSRASAMYVPVHLLQVSVLLKNKYLKYKHIIMQIMQHDC